MNSLKGQTVAIIGGSRGIGLATGRLARAEGAEVIITGRNRYRLSRAADELHPRGISAFDATDSDALARFFATLDEPVDHIMLAAGGAYYATLPDFDFEEARRSLDEHLWLPLHVARHSIDAVRPGGSLVLISGTGARRPSVGLTLAAVLAVGLPALVRDLALELAPTRVNLLAPGFVDTPLSASILGDQLDARRDQLASTLPIRRVVEPDDVAALAVHLMVNTALTAGTFDIDGGQQVAASA